MVLTQEPRSQDLVKQDVQDSLFFRQKQTSADVRRLQQTSTYVSRRQHTSTEQTHVLFTPMETLDSILLRIHRLTNDVYFVGTNYNDISVPVKGNLRFEVPK